MQLHQSYKKKLKNNFNIFNFAINNLPETSTFINMKEWFVDGKVIINTIYKITKRNKALLRKNKENMKKEE